MASRFSLEPLIKKIVAARKEKGMSQRSLSKKVGIPQSHLSKIERLEVDPRGSSLLQIARALELDLIVVHRSHLSLIEALSEKEYTSEQVPAYRLSDKEEDD